MCVPTIVEREAKCAQLFALQQLLQSNRIKCDGR
jgi:hypothetical protein